ncbi:hypothetical protein Nizo2535_0515 [Lactiplantibacillus plantarum]|nr:hypothetical protein Nizo1838_0118 [Lactiplantibacillus plantarum]KZT86757.1 hypothetical protein Nizo2256_2576 [Lactiplantibacillus plantarum]KZU34676.1 hypothetical protein Nizo2535_0515 [Lactiplantibacillus plantarum]KZU39687.1 hypothetical protein Nizo2757_2667 [Lactiplantibacillus plantarum]KZU44113.1 hypothetical protein Nizo2766_2218 [Lactiplantibacillus plantarum]
MLEHSRLKKFTRVRTFPSRSKLTAFSPIFSYFGMNGL